MARLRMVNPSDVPEPLRSVIDAPNKTQLELGPVGVYAQVPEIAAAYARFTGMLRASGVLPRRLIELVRLRIAFHNQCRSCMAIRYRDAEGNEVDEELVCQLSSPQAADDFTDAEKAVLDFADRFATNHLSIDDDRHRGAEEVLQRTRDHRTRYERRALRRVRSPCGIA